MDCGLWLALQSRGFDYKLLPNPQMFGGLDSLVPVAKL
jgi:hypothetical protein